MNVYLIPGLGANRSVFEELTFPEYVQVHFLDPFPPLQKETLKEYAHRLANRIDQNNPFILIGQSFGGMIATEISQFLHPVKTILLSSVACKNELPVLYRYAGILKLHKIIPVKLKKKTITIGAWLNDLQTKEEKQKLLKILRESDPTFIRWGMDAILNWDRRQAPEGLIRIHGTKDRILPAIKKKTNYLIQDGSHFMTVNRSFEISIILNQIITSTKLEHAI